MSNDLAGHVLLVTGPPGAGKTTASAGLASAAPVPAVHLHADDFWGFIKRGRIEPFLPESHAQNAVVLNALSSAAGAYAAGAYLVIVDGIVGPWFLPPFRALDAPLHYVVLRPSLAVALARVHARGGPAPLTSGPIRSLHRQFSNLGELEGHVIDTTSHAPAETRAAVRAAAESGRFRLS